MAFEYVHDRHNPVADPDILLCTHGLRQLPDLPAVLAMDGSAIRRSISFSAIVHHEAKFSIDVTLRCLANRSYAYLCVVDLISICVVFNSI